MVSREFGKNKLVILDIDELLVHRTRKSDLGYLDNKFRTINISKEERFLSGESVCFETKEYWIDTRKNLRSFLDKLFKNYKVGIWTSSMYHNAKEIINFILTFDQFKKLVFFWCRDRTSLDPDFQFENKKISPYATVKYLTSIIQHPIINEKRYWNNNNILVIDDKESKLRFNEKQTQLIFPDFNEPIENIWNSPFFEED